MSRSLYFYRIIPAPRSLPPVLRSEDYDEPYVFSPIDHAAQWEKEYGIPRTVEYETIDEFSVAEKYFGSKPSSITHTHDYYLNPESVYAEAIFFYDGRNERLPRSEMEKYKETKQYEALVYQRESLSTIDEAYLFTYEEFEDRVLHKSELLDIAKRFVEENDENYSEPLYKLMKMYFEAGEDDVIVCIVD